MRTAMLDRRAADDVAPTGDAAYRIVMLRASWDTQDKLEDWAEAAGFDLSWNYDGWPQRSEDFDFHVTLVASSNQVTIPDGCRCIDPLTLTPESYGVLGADGRRIPVIKLALDKKLTDMRQFFISAYGVQPTFADFVPHISLSYKWDGTPDIVQTMPMLPDFPLVFDVLMVSCIDPPSKTADARPARKMMSYADKAAISGTRRTSDGYLVTEARVARGGNVQDYYAHELQEPGDPNRVIRVYRPADEIFKRDSLATFAHKPVTLGHPATGVSPQNYRDEAIGHLGSEVLRDGEFVRVPLVVMDGPAIKDIESGTREISMGYDCELVMEGGTTPTGETFDAYQKNVRINHCAVVEAGRAGPQCRIGDQSRLKQQQKEESTMTKPVTIDGQTFQVADDVAVAIAKDQAKAKEVETSASAQLKAAADQLTAATEVVKALKADKEAAEVAVKAPTADELHALAATLSTTIDAAKKIAPDLEVKGKTVEVIKKDAVTAKLGDKAVAGKDAAFFDAAFVMLTSTDAGKDPVADALRNRDTNTKDGATKARDAYLARLTKGRSAA